VKALVVSFHTTLFAFLVLSYRMAYAGPWPSAFPWFPKQTRSDCNGEQKRKLSWMKKALVQASE